MRNDRFSVISHNISFTLMINNQSRTRQAFWLGIGSLVSFSFGIVSSAILSRILTVEEYGTYRQVLYVYSTLLIVFTLGLPRAYSFFLARLPLEQGKKSIEKINTLFLLLGSVFSLLLFFGANFIGTILKNPALPTCIHYFALTPIFLLPVLGIESILATYKKTVYATLYIILSRLFNLICVVIPVIIWNGGANTAVLGFTVSSAICCWIGLFLERRPFKNTKTEKSPLSLINVLKYSFPLLLASIWAIMINSAPQFFISRWYGTEAFAEFANGFIELPFAGMVISAVSTVLLPEISRLSQDESNIDRVLTIWRSSFEKSAKIIYPLAIFTCIFAPQIVECLYGSKYTGATAYFRLIVVINLMRVVPYAPIMMGLDMGHKYAVANLIPALLAVILDLIWVYTFNNPYGIAAIQCFVILVCVTIMLFYIAQRTNVRVSFLLPVSFCSKIIIVSIISSLLAYLSVSLVFSVINTFLQLLIGTILFGIIYLLLCFSLKINYLDLFGHFIQKAK